MGASLSFFFFQSKDGGKKKIEQSNGFWSYVHSVVLRNSGTRPAEVHSVKRLTNSEMFAIFRIKLLCSYNKLPEYKN